MHGRGCLTRAEFIDVIRSHGWNYETVYCLDGPCFVITGVINGGEVRVAGYDLPATRIGDYGLLLNDVYTLIGNCLTPYFAGNA